MTACHGDTTRCYESGTSGNHDSDVYAAIVDATVEQQFCIDNDPNSFVIVEVALRRTSTSAGSPYMPVQTRRPVHSIRVALLQDKKYYVHFNAANTHEYNKRNKNVYVNNIVNNNYYYTLSPTTRCAYRQRSRRRYRSPPSPLPDA